MVGLIAASAVSSVKSLQDGGIHAFLKKLNKNIQAYILHLQKTGISFCKEQRVMRQEGWGINIKGGEGNMQIAIARQLNKAELLLNSKLNLTSPVWVS